MSTQVGTSRAGRTSKDKHAKSTAAAPSTSHNSQTKTEKTAPKNQATVEQLRMAQIIDSGKAANADTVKQLCEMTGRSEDDVIVALHDAKDDADKAVEILLEGGGGEWEVQDKKKKRSNTLKSDKDSAVIHDNDRGDARPDRSRDRFDYDRGDAPPRRGRDRRNGGPPPRLANRGRGRERNNYRGNPDRDRSGNVERPNYNDRGNTFNGEEDWEAEMGGGGNDFREQRRGDRDRGFGGDRGRGRGRGGGGFGRPSTSRGGRPRRFDRPNESGPSEGPYIDTWTNETAENAEKENSAWGETWGDTQEDWADDQWTGSLEDTKVFTPSQSKPLDTDMSPALNDSTNSLGQRLEIGSLFSKSSEFAKAPDFTKTGEQTSGDSFFTNYNQQAAESIKNSIGIGSSSARQNLSNIPASQPQSLGQLPAMPQRDMGPSRSSMLPSSASMLPPATSAPLPSQSAGQQAQPQRRPQRSKMPPPSKIPASAVEMPGHMIPQLDVQFGVDFGSDSNQFGFGSTGDTNSSYSNASPPSSTSLSNHLRQAEQAQQDSSRQTNIMSSPSAGSKPSQNSMPQMDVSPSRPSVFPSSVYTTPTKADSAPNKVAEPIPYPSVEHKSSGLMNTQITTQSPSALSQGTMSTSKPDSSSLPNFSVANGYSGSSYNSHSSHSQSHKSPSSTSQTYPHGASGSQTSQSVASSFPNQFSSQTQFSGSQQSQYPSANQGQFPGSQNQFPVAGSAGGSAQSQTSNQYLSGQSQYPGSNQGSSFPSAPVVTQSQFQGGSGQYHSNYQSSSSPFQSQQGGQSAAQNSLYPNTTQPSGSYQSASGSFHVRDSQSAGSLQQSSGSQPSNSFQAQQSSQPGSNYQNQQGSQPGSNYQTQPASQPGSNYPSQQANQPGNSYPTQQTNQPGNSYQSQQASQPNSNYSSQQNSQPGSNYPNQTPAPGLNKATTTQSGNTYNTSTFSSQHGQSLQASPLSNKLGDSLSKMTLKDATSLDSRSNQFDHGSNSTTSVSLSSVTTNSSSISTTTSTVSATSTPVATSSTLNSRVSASLPVTTKAPPNLPPGVPLVSPHLFMGQPPASGLPPYFGMQQPLYGYEDLQMLQQRLPLQTGNYYDLTAYSGVPSTIATGRDQTPGIAPASFTGTGTDNKQINRVEAQSPSQSSQQQSAPQQTMPFNFHYGYYYPGVLPGAASFQYPTMFQMPPVTNAAAAAAAHVPGTTTAAQLPKTYGSHQGFPSKGTGSTADINTGAFTKSHTQGFDKQGFPGGTPPPFNLPLANASQAGPLAAPAAPYGAPFLPMMPPQAHNQTILHHALQQDSGSGSGRGLQQAANQGKSGTAKPYGSNWGY